MDCSHSQQIYVACSHCGVTLEVDVWVIVDCEARPDLLEQIFAGTFHQTECLCGIAIQIDAPLLVWCASVNPQPFFLPARESTAEQSNSHRAELLNRLRPCAGSALVPKKRRVWSNFTDPAQPSSQLFPSAQPEVVNVNIRAVDNIKYAELLATLTPAVAPPELRAPVRDANRAAQKYWDYGDLTALDNSIMHWQRILANLESARASTRFKAIAENGAAVVLLHRFNAGGQAGGQVEDLEAGVRLSRAALQRIGTSDLFRPTFLNDLGAALHASFSLTHQTQDLDEAIVNAQQAVDKSSSDNPFLRYYYDTLGVCRLTCYESTDNPHDLEQALEAFRRALNLTPPVDPRLPASLNNLALALRHRYMRKGQMDDLNEAIRMLQSCIEMPLRGGPQLWEYQQNLAGCLHARYDRIGSAADLGQAIELLRRIVQIAPPHVSGRDSVFAVLSYLLYEHYKMSNKGDRDEAIDTLQEAIDLAQQAIERVPPTSPALPEYLERLGNCLYGQFKLTNRSEDLTRAVGALEQAQQLMSSTNLYQTSRVFLQLAICLQARYALNENKLDKLSAIDLYRRACHDGLQSSPQVALRSALNWANWSSVSSAWIEAAEAYSQAIKASLQLYRMQILRTDKESWLKHEQDLHAAAAIAMIHASVAPQHDNRSAQEQQRVYERAAVVALEQGRARVLGEGLARDRADLKEMQRDDPRTYEAYQEAVNAIRHLEAASHLTGGTARSHSAANLSDRLRDAHADLDTVIARIRRVARYSDFLSMPDWGDVVEAVQEECPLVYLVAKDAGGLALCIYRDNSGATAVEIVWLKGLTERALCKLSDNQRERLDQLTRHLWDIAVGPVIGWLERRGAAQAILIPTGQLGLLPLHAAWIERNGKRVYALDCVTLSYAPSARVLAQSRRIAAKTSAERLLAVADTVRLRDTLIEIEAVTTLFEAPTIYQGKDATCREILEHLPHAQVFHCACHGHAYLAEPLQSALQLADGELTVDKLLTLNLADARLAVLSACETGMLGTELPDEVVALSSAFLRIGFAGVVSSLWQVEDDITAILMERFYRLWRIEKLEPSDALCRAQIWLRDTTNGEKMIYYKEYLAEQAQMAGALPASFLDELYKFFLPKDDNGRPFRDVLKWAAFTYTGS